ncbi:Uncharacterised protein [Bordetella pertussis]|nr:Uncharacterised protein [Bordetella pertussis]
MSAAQRLECLAMLHGLIPNRWRRAGAGGCRRRRAGRLAGRPGHAPGRWLCAAGFRPVRPGYAVPKPGPGQMVRAARRGRRRAGPHGFRAGGARLGWRGVPAFRTAGAGQSLRAAGVLARYPQRDGAPGAGRAGRGGSGAAGAWRAGRPQRGLAGPAGVGVRAVWRNRPAAAARCARLCLWLPIGACDGAQRGRAGRRAGAGVERAGRLRPPVHPSGAGQ